MSDLVRKAGRKVYWCRSTVYHAQLECGYMNFFLTLSNEIMYVHEQNIFTLQSTGTS